MKRDGYIVTIPVFNPDGDEVDYVTFDLALPQESCELFDTLKNSLESMVLDFEDLEEELKQTNYLKASN